MQNHYQYPTVYQPEQMETDFSRGMPSTSAHKLDMAMYTTPSMAYRPYEDSTMSSNASTSILSPTSMRSSFSAHTPLTPYSSASSPYHIKNQSQESWFGAQQDSYLASQHTAQAYAQGGRPQLPRMGRMSISSESQGLRQNNNLLTVDAPGPRRASVVTFQPTASRPSSVPRRPSFLPSSHSDSSLSKSPQQLYQPAYRQATPTRYSQPQPLDLARPPLPTIQQIPTPPLEDPLDVDKLFAEVFGGQPVPTTIVTGSPHGNHSQQFSPSYSYGPAAHLSPQSRPQQQPQPNSNFNFSGVLLQPEDLHMLGPDPLSPTAGVAPMQSAPLAQPAGWNNAFTLNAAPSRNLPVKQSYQPDWTFSSFHGFEPITGEGSAMGIPVDRPASAPPTGDAEMELLPAIVMTEAMDRRRGSSVDSPALLAFNPLDAPQSTYQASPAYMQSVQPPAYLSAPQPHASTLAVRRATIGPQPLSIATRIPYQPSYRSATATLPTQPSYLTSPPPTASKRFGVKVGSGSGRRASATSAPMFINFTSKDANKLLSGVAPSGSSKRKREEEEQARVAKLAKSD